MSEFSFFSYYRPSQISIPTHSSIFIKSFKALRAFGLHKNTTTTTTTMSDRVKFKRREERRRKKKKALKHVGNTNVIWVRVYKESEK
jgi:hypothetical protein